MTGRLVLVVASVLVVFQAPHASAHDGTCGGFAPLVTGCSTGQHTASATTTHGVRVPDGSFFTGTIMSDLDYVVAGRQVICRYVLGEQQGACTRDGFFQDDLPFTHRCYASIDLFTGPVGDWECFVTH